MSRILLLDICSIGSRFALDDGSRAIENDLMEEPKRLLLANLDNVSAENVQADILIADLCEAHLNASLETSFLHATSQSRQYLVNPIRLLSLAWKFYFVYIVILVVEVVYIWFLFVEIKGLIVEETGVLFNGQDVKISKEAGMHGDATFEEGAVGKAVEKVQAVST
ncbi:hypothetical protein CORC01_04624 [Colletotrichum orchidophilum]|uniref:Uncharacterized protein n=1 Tax=Colletotrichum orchidophilum TaxID=1209926 RepID=A0A1G4BF58_9PEZI|nr:uncharacterized protein CORC01_04624 [Colletotrichum orchidophilum]OHE99977.1 hypothetical protein CORC01_04624 [Colletotrichum orchidophilum]